MLSKNTIYAILTESPSSIASHSGASCAQNPFSVRTNHFSYMRAAQKWTWKTNRVVSQNGKVKENRIDRYKYTSLLYIDIHIYILCDDGNVWRISKTNLRAFCARTVEHSHTQLSASSYIYEKARPSTEIKGRGNDFRRFRKAKRPRVYGTSWVQTRDTRVWPPWNGQSLVDFPFHSKPTKRRFFKTFMRGLKSNCHMNMLLATSPEMFR